MTAKEIKFEEVHPDVRRYLENDCYCPHEVYGIDGFFYQLFYPEDPATVIESNGNETVAIVTHLPEGEEQKPSHTQIIVIWHDDEEHPGRIMNMQRFDATENNVGFFKKWIKKTLVKGVDKIDEYVPGSTAESVKKVMSIADCIMVD